MNHRNYILRKSLLPNKTYTISIGKLYVCYLLTKLIQRAPSTGIGRDFVLLFSLSVRKLLVFHA